MTALDSGVLEQSYWCTFDSRITCCWLEFADLSIHKLTINGTTVCVNLIVTEMKYRLVKQIVTQQIKKKIFLCFSEHSLPAELWTGLWFFEKCVNKSHSTGGVCSVWIGNQVRLTLLYKGWARMTLGISDMWLSFCVVFSPFYYNLG